MAKVAFKRDAEAQDLLRLYERQERRESEWKLRVQEFYDQILENEVWTRRMTRFGYDEARLRSELVLMDAVDVARYASGYRTRGDAKGDGSSGVWIAPFRLKTL